MAYNMNTFVEWLIGEVESRGWSFRYLGRRAGLSSGAISKVVTGAALPGWEFCRKVAAALGVPPETVFRLAGLLPPEPEETTVAREVNRLLSQLPLEEQRRFLNFLRAYVRNGRRDECK